MSRPFPSVVTILVTATVIFQMLTCLGVLIDGQPVRTLWWVVWLSWTQAGALLWLILWRNW